MGYRYEGMLSVYMKNERKSNKKSNFYQNIRMFNEKFEFFFNFPLESIFPIKIVKIIFFSCIKSIPSNTYFYTYTYFMDNSLASCHNNYIFHLIFCSYYHNSSRPQVCHLLTSDLCNRWAYLNFILSNPWIRKCLNCYSTYFRICLSWVTISRFGKLLSLIYYFFGVFIFYIEIFTFNFVKYTIKNLFILIYVW